MWNVHIKTAATEDSRDSSEPPATSPGSKSVFLLGWTSVLSIRDAVCGQLSRLTNITPKLSRLFCEISA